ncbi:MAG: hypothetical protein HUU01_08510 [Saprospiraceae bacterium]|nr:hypothetical protein [Saprospiraceae bacterium]
MRYFEKCAALSIAFFASASAKLFLSSFALHRKEPYAAKDKPIVMNEATLIFNFFFSACFMHPKV